MKSCTITSGHVHAYERTYPVYKSKRVDDAPMYIVVGDAGNREGLAKSYYHPRPVWSAFRRPRYGYGYLRTVNQTHARFEWHEDFGLRSIIQDSVWIQRGKESITKRTWFSMKTLVISRVSSVW